MKLSLPAQEFLKDLNSGLQKMGACPVLLRNYEDLPIEIGNDLDVFVKRDFLRSSATFLLAKAKEHGALLGHVHERDYFHALWLKFEGEERFWHVDLYPGALSWHGLSFLDEKPFLENCQKYDHWWIPGPSDEAMLLFMTSALWGGFSKEKYLIRIAKLLEKESEKNQFVEQFETSFGIEFSGVARSISEGDFDPKSIQSLAVRLRKALKWREFRRRPIESFGLTLRHWTGELKNYLLSRPGVVLTVPLEISELEEGQLSSSLSKASKFFGGKYDARLKNPGLREKIQSWLQEQRSLGKNHLVIKSGASWSIDGITVEPISESSAEKSEGLMAQILLNRM